MKVFAERGTLAAPTSAISKAAEVAEGTLFTYFSTKDELLNELYGALKREFAEVILADFPTDGDFEIRLRHIWYRYVQWGVAHPHKQKVLMHLQLPGQVSEATRAAAAAAFAPIERIGLDFMEDQSSRQYPVSFFGALFDSMAQTTITAIASNTDTDVDYCAAGFNILWRGISGH